MIGRHHRLNGHEFEYQLREMVKGREACVLQSRGSQRVGHDSATEQQPFGSVAAESPDIFLFADSK